MTVSPGPTLYDEIPYPGGVFPSTHPENLATLAELRGMTPAPVGRCRILELGCGFGANLLPMAFHYPKAEFVGIDLSGSSIARGQQNVAALGLNNIVLRHLDILDVGPDFGAFDYIVSHGVYSWVPEPVREKMIRIFKDNLAPQGVCYVSYNAYPFSHARNLVRDVALFHTRHISDPREKVAQARAILRFVNDAAAADSVHGAILREQYARIEKMADEFFFHDDLNEIAQAFLLHQVVERAQTVGLQYLGDASFARGDVGRYPDNVRAVLQSFPGEERVARDQYQDFIDGYGFRRTLLCHADVALRRDISPDFFRRCHFTSASALVEDQSDAKKQSELPQGTRDKSVLGLSHRAARAVDITLSNAWPCSVSFDALLTASRDDAGAGEPPGDSELDECTLAEVMHELACRDAVAFSLYPRRYPNPEPKKLFTGALARRQAETGPVVVNLLHQSVRLENDDARYILRLLDGTRDFDQLVTEVRARMLATRSISSEPAGGHAGNDTTEVAVRQFLRQVKQLGLMAE